MASAGLCERVGMTRRRRRGQVMIIALLALALLAGMVFYVINVGEQVTRRASMQSAADAAAIGAATVMARHMNVIAMNNVAQTRLITNVAVLDSLPLATKMSYEELTEWLYGLDIQLNKGIPDAYLMEGLRSMTERFRGEQRTLQPVYDALEAANYREDGTGSDVVAPLTFWRRDGASGDTPHGQLWQAAKALEDFSRAALETVGMQCQAAATQMGGACIVRGDAQVPAEYGSAFSVPVLAQMPASPGEFRDFQSPIERGRPKEYQQGTTSDYIRRGPYDQLFLWRDAIYDMSQYEVISRTFVPGTAGPMRNADAHGVGGKVVGTSVVGGPQDHYNTVTRRVGGPQIGWSTYGTYTWSLYNKVRDSGLAYYCNGRGGTSRDYRGELHDTNFLENLRTLSKAKLDYMWGASAKTIHHPQWISPYPEARQFVGDPLPDVPPAQPVVQPGQPTGASEVAFTMFYMVQTKSSISPDSPSFRTAGTYVTNSHDPQAIWLKGWVDPVKWETDPQKKARKIADYVWQVDWDYETTFDTTIGLQRPPPLLPGQEPVWHKVYIREQYVFGGIDIGKKRVIRNPANFGSDAPPVPVVLDLKEADYTTNDLRTYREGGTGPLYYLAFLGVARQTTQATIWPARFVSGNPYRNVWGLAEAHVFNNQSWDLWTQDWQARLRPITDWEYWVNARMQDPNISSQLAQVSHYVNNGNFEQIKLVLQSYDTATAELLKTH